MPKENLTIQLPTGPAIELVYVQGGTFMMGSDDSEGQDCERPVHQVKLSDYYIGKYPVTQEQWQAVMKSNPSGFKGEKLPLEQVSWNDTQNFFEKFKHVTEKAFRLPTEAEWEFAARGGIYSQGYTYAGSDRLKQVGWYTENSDRETHEVGQLLANELGLHDMSGNIWEWCQDWFDSEYYAECHKCGVVKNPQGPDTGRSCVLRGGTWLHSPMFCRSVYRHFNHPQDRHAVVGFRLVLPFQAS